MANAIIRNFLDLLHECGDAEGQKGGKAAQHRNSLKSAKALQLELLQAVEEKKANVTQTAWSS